jgi:hypothetical protein
MAKKKPVQRNQKPTSFRLSPEALALIKQLAEALGLSQAAVLELAIRRLARSEKIGEGAK